MKMLFADVEGDNFIDDLKVIWTIQIAEGVDGEVTVYADQPGYKPLSEARDRLKAADKVVFHNAWGFDYFAINKVYPGTLRTDQIIDTLIIGRMIEAGTFRMSLDEIGRKLGYPKGSHDDFSKFTPEMATYGARDVEILQKAWVGVPEKKVWSFGKYYDKYTEACDMEGLTAYVIEKQRQHGFRFDMEAAQKLEIELRSEYLQLEKDLQKIFPPIVTERYSEKQFDKITGKPKRLKDDVEVFNPGSRPQIAKRLIDKYGWKPKNWTDTHKVKVDEDILSELPYPEAQAMARYMKLGKKLGQLTDGTNAWMKMAQEKPNGDFYIHGQVNTLGTRTTRMSHFKPNVAQADGDAAMRALWLPDRGHYLIGVDAEGLELRMLAHFLHPYDDGFYSEVVHSGDKSKGTDIHTVNQKAAGLFLRDSAKTMILKARIARQQWRGNNSVNSGEASRR